MKFAYVYKQPDGTRCEGVEVARSREAVFERLRERGIRAIKVEPTGWLYVHRALVRRTVLVLLLAVIAALTATLWRERPSAAPVAAQTVRQRFVDPRVARPRPRKQVAGFEQVDLSKVFAHPLERYLAGFAQPGVRRRRPSLRDLRGTVEEDLTEALEDDILFVDGEPEAVSEVKRIVAGLKEEVSMLVAAGKGMREIGEWLEGRQHMECEYRAQVLQGAGTLDEKNARLKAMGLPEAGAGEMR